MISRDICQRVLQKAVSTGADYAEIFAENTVNHSINMIANKVDAMPNTWGNNGNSDRLCFGGLQNHCRW